MANKNLKPLNDVSISNPILNEINAKLSVLTMAIEGLYSFVGSELEGRDVDTLAFAAKDIQSQLERLC